MLYIPDERKTAPSFGVMNTLKGWVEMFHTFAPALAAARKIIGPWFIGQVIYTGPYHDDYQLNILAQSYDLGPLPRNPGYE